MRKMHLPYALLCRMISVFLLHSLAHHPESRKLQFFYISTYKSLLKVSSCRGSDHFMSKTVKIIKDRFPCVLTDIASYFLTQRVLSVMSCSVSQESKDLSVQIKHTQIKPHQRLLSKHQNVFSLFFMHFFLSGYIRSHMRNIH